ncbi:hypothetical protein ACO0LM_18140 [Undibacterium sp. Di26W]|uniref:hypothetical protein n=1 Tax=Undibacterium sp. Di26W TaxID=3413035 RepID=UPI003BF1C774
MSASRLSKKIDPIKQITPTTKHTIPPKIQYNPAIISPSNLNIKNPAKIRVPIIIGKPPKKTAER